MKQKLQFTPFFTVKTFCESRDVLFVLNYIQRTTNERVMTRRSCDYCRRNRAGVLLSKCESQS